MTTTHATATPPAALTARPTGPRGLPVLGPLFPFARDPLAFVTRVAGSHGDVARFDIAGTPIFLLSHPGAIQEVLVGRHKDAVKDQITRGLSRALGQGLLTSEGDTWRRQRKLAAPSFSRADIAVYADAMVAIGHGLADSLSDGEIRDVHHDMTGVTLDVVVRTLFDRDAVADAGGVGNSVTAMVEAYRHAYIGWQRLLPDWVPTPSRVRFRRAVRSIDGVLNEVIADGRAREQRGSDLLSRLLAATDDDGTGMSDRQLRDEIITLFLAGHETTAIALTCALYLLGTHPEIRARAIAEIDTVLGGRPATAADVPRLRFIDAVMRETMRLYPPAWIIGREATRDIEAAGTTIPAGAQILMSQWVIHRDPRWFREPVTFLPDRWLDGSTDNLPRYAYVPFGGGPRVCIGNHFAMLEAQLILATLLQHVELCAVPDTRLELFPAITLRPTVPVRMQVCRRAQTVKAMTPEHHSEPVAKAG
ncbi:MAG TPA: cytochrome P450 [Kofleriaceae bacterium]|nr:cytochrome P450 [Kofleriaceae bacterium]